MHREYTLASAYIETTCTVSNVTYTGLELRCTYCSGGKDRFAPTSSAAGRLGFDHGAACVTSQFPCVRIVVRYRTVDGVENEALLHPDSLQAAGLYSQVSVT